ncbi:hypothetical protein Adt_21049 [Abeliophyllum distichum]|uniref:Uncharacterized protein n=1 Tax=Abeliophyllum distichum TaxID=126358 RepID=A0ABD1SYK4_9LAMI
MGYKKAADEISKDAKLLEVRTILTPAPEEVEIDCIQGLHIPRRRWSPIVQRSTTPPRPSSPPSHTAWQSPNYIYRLHIPHGYQIKMPILLMEELKDDVRCLNKKVGHLNKKVDEVIELMRPYRNIDVAPETILDRTLVVPPKFGTEVLVITVGVREIEPEELTVIER